jgi:chromatin remodeling complex protein RSC6
VTVTATPAAVVPAATAATAATDAAVETTTTLVDEVAALQTQLTTIRDAASAALAALKRVTKRASQEVKEARKNRRRQRSEPADGTPRKPSNFEIPVPISDELSAFLGRGKNSSVSRASVNKSLNDYIKSHGLNQGQNINPDATLRKLLTVPEGESLTIFNIQKYMRRHFLKPAAATTAAPAKA